MAARRPPHVPTRMPKLDATGIVRHPLEQSDRPPAQIYLPNSTVHRALYFRLSSRPPCPVRPPAPGLPSALHPGQGPASLLLTPRAIPRLPSPWPCPKARSLRSLRKKDLEDHHASPHSPSQRTGAIQRAIDFRDDEQPAFSILKTTRKRKVACVDVVYPASLHHHLRSQFLFPKPPSLLLTLSRPLARPPAHCIVCRAVEYPDAPVLSSTMYAAWACSARARLNARSPSRP